MATPVDGTLEYNTACTIDSGVASTKCKVGMVCENTTADGTATPLCRMAYGSNCETAGLN